DFQDESFRGNLRTWLTSGVIRHSVDHVKPLADVNVPAECRDVGRQLADRLMREKAIMGVFDEGCMGMFNAIIPDHLLNPTGAFKERLSQSTLYFESMQVSDAEAREVRRWMEDKGMRFHTGPNHATDLTDEQILQQCKMY